MKKILGKILRLFILLALTGAIITGLLWLVENRLGNTVSDLLIHELNQHLTSEVSVEDATFQLVRFFPNAAITLTNVNAGGAYRSVSGPLINAEKISLLISLSDLIQQRYKLTGLQIKNGLMVLSVNEKGDRNWDIFTQNGKNSEEPGRFSLELNKVRLENIRIVFQHQPAGQEYRFSLNTATIKGIYTPDGFESEFEGGLTSEFFRSGSTTFLKETPVRLQLSLNWENKDKRLSFEQFSIGIQDILLSGNGSIQINGSQWNTRLNFHTENTNIETVTGMIPAPYNAIPEFHKMKGVAGIDAVLSGTVSRTTLPGIKVKFSVDQGSFLLRNDWPVIDHVRSEGQFNAEDLSRPETFIAEVSEFSGRFDGGMAEGSLSIRNFNRPEVKTGFRSNVQLERFSQYLPDPVKGILKGRLGLNLAFSNRLATFRNLTTDDLLGGSIEGNIEIEDGYLNRVGTSIPLSDINGKLHFDSHLLKIDFLQASSGLSDLELKGWFRNLPSWLAGKEIPLYINAHLRSNNLVVDDLILNHPDDSSGTLLQISPNLGFDIDFDIGHFKFRSFDAEEASGRIRLQNQMFRVDTAFFKSMKGTAALSGTVDGRDTNLYHVSCRAEMNNINIHDLFAGFGNFGQNSITDKNLNGLLNAHLLYRSDLTPELVIPPASVWVSSSLEISNGELIQYTPLYALSGFIRLDELSHLHFDKLKNDILIKDETVIIPDMHLATNRRALDLRGEHTFDNRIDYHIKLGLRDWLSKNKKLTENNIEGIFEDPSDRSQPYLVLHVTGTADDPVVQYDSKEAWKKLKNRLKESFSFSSEDHNDTNENLNQEKSTGNNFKINSEWNKPESEKSTQPQDESSRPDTLKERKKNFKIIWEDQKDTIPG
ncbi:MAG: hypothetical protein Kow00127_23790 [Bacteroidales bacterium]